MLYYVSPQCQRWIGRIAVEVETSHGFLLYFVAVRLMAADGQPDRINMELHMKQMCVTEFLFSEKMPFIDTY